MSGDRAVTLAVIAKAPVAGRVKTRLCPPCTPAQAAALAEAALRDTLAAMAEVSVTATGRTVRRAIVLDGAPGPWHRDERIVAQRGNGLDERLAAAFDDLRGTPTLIVGMDTPQLTAALLSDALAALDTHDAVLGPVADGGYWCIGLRRADPRTLLGVPMSTDHTLAAQRARLDALGLTIAEVGALVDVDTIDDAEHVAAHAPQTHFAHAFTSLHLTADGGPVRGRIPAANRPTTPSHRTTNDGGPVNGRRPSPNRPTTPEVVDNGGPVNGRRPSSNSPTTPPVTADGGPVRGRVPAANRPTTPSHRTANDSGPVSGRHTAANRPTPEVPA